MSNLDELRQEAHLSCSAVGAYVRCPRMFQHRYVLRTPSAFRPGALAFGSAIHEALAAFYGALKHGFDIFVEDILDVFKSALREQLSGDIPVLLDDKETLESILATGEKMLRVFYANAERPYKVLEVELPWRVEMFDPETGEVLPSLVGAFDAVVQNKVGEIEILEHKTGARRWTEDRLKYDLQLSAYKMAASAVGFPEAKLKIQLLLKTKQPGFETYRVTRTRTDELEFAQVAAAVCRAAQAEVFFPIRDWHCKSCPYAVHCIPSEAWRIDTACRSSEIQRTTPPITPPTVGGNHG